MKFRNDPRMAYRGIFNWPPLWIEQRGQGRLKGDESGVLTEVGEVPECDKCYLYITHDGKTYVGCLLFDRAASCRFAIDLLKRNIGRHIQTIGDLETAEKLSA